MKIDFLKILDKYIGFVVCLVLTFLSKLFGFGKTPVRKENIKKTLAMKFLGLGSILLLSPTIKEFRKTYPDSKLVFLTLNRNKEICESLKLFDEVITVNIDKGWLVFSQTFLRVLLYFWRERFDLVLDFEFFTRFSSIVAFLTFAKVKIGYHAWETWRGDIHSVNVPFNRYWHIMDNFYNLGIHIGLDKQVQLKIVKPFVEAADRDVVAKLLKEAGVKDGYIAVHVNASDLSVERIWPAGNFIRLIGKILNKYDLNVVFIGSKADQSVVGGICRRIAHPRAVDLSGKTSIRQLAALFENSKLVISNDGGPLHLAVAMEAPTVSFFGPETPLIYGPRGAQHAVFFKNIECSPCINVHDRKSVRCYWTLPKCMEAITVEEVFDIVEKKLAISQ